MRTSAATTTPRTSRAFSIRRPTTIRATITPILALGTKTFDVMAYCLPQWLSDQNYVRIYQNLTGNTPFGPTIANPQHNGNWLVVYGSIVSGTNTAYMDYVQHTIGNVTVPARVPGNYAIRLRDSSGNVLQDYAFTPNAETDSSAVIVRPGRHVRDRHARYPHRALKRSTRAGRSNRERQSAHRQHGSRHQHARCRPPVVVTVTWSATDPDNNLLKFDVLYSRDNGTSFQPLILHTITPTAPIDTVALGGGTGKFRIVAVTASTWVRPIAPAFRHGRINRPRRSSPCRRMTSTRTMVR